jgi:hypothetical protein
MEYNRDAFRTILHAAVEEYLVMLDNQEEPEDIESGWAGVEPSLSTIAIVGEVALPPNESFPLGGQKVSYWCSDFREWVQRGLFWHLS